MVREGGVSYVYSHLKTRGMANQMFALRGIVCGIMGWNLVCLSQISHDLPGVKSCKLMETSSPCILHFNQLDCMHCDVLR